MARSKNSPEPYKRLELHAENMGEEQLGRLLYAVQTNGARVIAWTCQPGQPGRSGQPAENPRLHAGFEVPQKRLPLFVESLLREDSLRLGWRTAAEGSGPALDHYDVVLAPAGAAALR